MSVTNKVKVRKIYPFSDNKKEAIKKNTNNKETSQMPMSAELLKYIVFLAFLFASFCAIIVNFACTYEGLLHYYDSLFQTTILKAIMVLSISTYTSYVFFLIRKTKICFIIFLLISYLVLILSIHFFFYSRSKLCDYTIIIISSNVFGSFFAEVGREIICEKDKNYILNYFSALTAFVALIVSLVALFK